MSYTLHHGRVEDVLPTLDAESFDSVFCDPPFGIRFMNASWDHGVPSAAVWRQVLAALRPGGHVAAFGGSRTYHRLACAIEDAGAEIRDCVTWVHGQGMPKASMIGKMIDREKGATRDVVGRYQPPNGTTWNLAKDTNGVGYGGNEGHGKRAASLAITAPATPEAAAWEGHAPLLKPAYEPAVLAMKPLDGTFAHNALKHGVAGLAIDACRVGTSKPSATPRTAKPGATYGDMSNDRGDTSGYDPNVGRWPSNLILDETAAESLDAQTGARKSGGATRQCARVAHRNAYGVGHGAATRVRENDGSSASRFFYTAKASSRERSLGLPPGQPNRHSCVKPIALTTYLARLLLPPYTGRPRRLLVPYAGSGSEMLGALLAGWDHVVGIELDPTHCEVARARIEHWTRKARLAPEAAE